MNKYLLLFSVAMAAFLSGCLCVSQGYVPPVPSGGAAVSPRYDVSYSLSYQADGEKCTGSADVAQMREMIEEKLKASGHFSSVTYCQAPEKSRYHIHFMAHYSQGGPSEPSGQDILMVCTLGLIPTWRSMYLDLSAIAFVDQEKVYSTVALEKLRNYVWLPLLPVNIFWNSSTVWRKQEWKCIDYVVEDIACRQASFGK